MARRKLIAGNWKMNLTASEGAKLIAEDHMALCEAVDQGFGSQIA